MMMILAVFRNKLRADREGFTLLEILIALTIFSVGVMAIAQMLLSMMRGNVAANRLTSATYLAQQKLEEVLAAPFDDITAANFPAENYNTIANYPDYKRALSITTNSANTFKTLTITVYWKNADGTDHQPGVQLITKKAL